MSKENSKKTKVENQVFEFEPIKGYPMLNWKGKRPFTSTQYFPAQLKELYGKPSEDGWLNKIFWGDNLQVMSHLLKNYRGKVDLVYIDPPFDSKADYKKTIKLNKNLIQNDTSSFEEKQYSDIWANDEYLQFIYERLILLKELISPNGSIYVHCDYRKNSHIRLILDEVFGAENLINEIVWQRIYSHTDANKFGVIHDTILLYSKSSSFIFNKQFRPHSQSYIESHYGQINEEGRNFRLVTLSAAGGGPSRMFGNKEIAPPPGRHWAWSQEKINEGLRDGIIVFTSTGQPNIKKYLDESNGTAIPSVWTDIYSVNPASFEQTNYPTQKPEALIERIIKSSSNPGDLILDCFMGAGTTQAVAMRLGRRFLGADINIGSIQTTSKRLIKLSKEIKEHKPVGFEIYNVNNYDFFRNPTEAKDIILSALGVSPLKNSIFDGILEGRLVKVLPINRIASKADLSDLISGLDYKKFEKIQKEKPSSAVEKILLVCMGHEPDLSAHLLKEINFKIDLEIVDILRDKKELHFKRESEAKIQCKKGSLVIEKFYPMNLLQKLSLNKEKIEDWKELVESVLIDFNFDGAVLQPSIIDIPGKNELVNGTYLIPADSGVIRVKITDLLSESIEIEVLDE